jgi:hypothetical protein
MPSSSRSRLRGAHAFRELLRVVEADLDRCWALLRPELWEDEASVLRFQPALLEALQKLEREYEAIAAERRRLIARKASLSTAWFNRRQKLLAKRQDILRTLSYVGRAMGDAFAWMFYHDDRDLLEEHAKHERVAHVPTGLGGRGELEFIRNVPGVGGLLVLYHGTTTILRLGDFSLVDPGRLRVIAVGELKTRRVSDHELSIQAVFTGTQDAVRQIFEALKPSPPAEGAEGRLDALPPKMRSQLDRQLRRNLEALARPKLSEATPVGLSGPTYVRGLGEAIRRARRGRFTVHQAGPGLAYVVYRCTSRTLTGRLDELSTRVKSRLADSGGLVKQTIPLVIRDSAFNTMILTGLQYTAKDVSPIHPGGGLPLYWSGLEPELVRRLIFLDSTVVSIYNSAHLVRALEQRGWSVTKPGSPADIQLILKDGTTTKAQLPGILQFINMVIYQLLTEDQVADAVAQTIERALEMNPAPGTRVDLNFRHSLRPPGTDYRDGPSGPSRADHEAEPR